MNRRRTVRRRFGLLVGVVLATSVGCGGENGRATTVSLDDWVRQFDTVCDAVTARLDTLGADMGQAEFAAFTAGSMTTLGALPPPDQHADVAAGLLADMESSQRPGLDQAAIDDLDGRIVAAMTTLGISDACTGGTPG